MTKEVNAEELQEVLNGIIGMIPDTEKQLKNELETLNKGIVKHDGTVNNDNKNLVSNTLIGLGGNEDWENSVIIEWCKALGVV